MRTPKTNQDRRKNMHLYKDEERKSEDDENNIENMRDKIKSLNKKLKEKEKELKEGEKYATLLSDLFQ